jgi:hypothetical protein
MRYARSWSRIFRLAGVTSVALAFVAGSSLTALAGTINPVNTSYDRPGITYMPGGTYEIAWAGADASGKVNIASVAASGNVNSKYTYPGSSTYGGTGAAISGGFYSFALVAWTDLNATVHVALDTGGGLACDSTNFGSSVDTPYLTLAANGVMYLTTVDGNLGMHVTEITDNGCVNEGSIGGNGTLGAGQSTAIIGNTTYSGPTLVDLHQYGTPDLWLIWSGANSAHNINIASFIPGQRYLGQQSVESSHSTITDFGSTQALANGWAFFTYCGTNNVTYGQYLSDSGPGVETQLGSDRCNVSTAAGYTNGGVDVTLNGQTDAFSYFFPNTSLDLTLDNYS